MGNGKVATQPSEIEENKKRTSTSYQQR